MEGGGKMKAFVVFDTKTGDIWHVHHEATMEGEERKVEREEVLDNAIGRGEEGPDVNDLEILELDGDELQAGRRLDVELFVDPERRTLAQRERPKAADSRERDQGEMEAT